MSFNTFFLLWAFFLTSSDFFNVWLLFWGTHNVLFRMLCLHLQRCTCCRSVTVWRSAPLRRRQHHPQTASRRRSWSNSRTRRPRRRHWWGAMHSFCLSPSLPLLFGSFSILLFGFTTVFRVFGLNFVLFFFCFQAERRAQDADVWVSTRRNHFKQMITEINEYNK